MIKDLHNIVGTENVLDDQEALAHYSTDQSLSHPRIPFAVVKPKNSEEVQELVAFANKTLTPVIPVSSGVHFWGATLPEEGGVIVELSRMDKILEIDPQNRRVKIEPGVTWHKLQEALAENDQMPLNPLFPHPKSSALTGSLEGEAMLIPKYEYSDPVLTSQVVLGNGSLIKTGMAAANNTQGVYPEGPGTNFIHFFQGAQGTLGIVTWLNIKTEYRPKEQKAFFAAFNELEDAAEPIYKLQRRHLGNECFILNKFLMASLLREQDGDFEKLMQDLPPYTMVLVIAGAPRRPLERIAYEEEALMEIAGDLRFEPAKTVGGVAGLGTKMIDMLRNLPSTDVYWKNRFKNSTQDIFFITTMDRAQAYADIALSYATCYGLNINEVGVYMQPLERGRACHLSFCLPCDLDNDAERENIRELYLELSDRLISEDAFFSRPYGVWADRVYRRCAIYTAKLKQLKKIFDPNNILNPGKLCH